MAGGGRHHGPPHSRQGRYDAPAYGNTTSWRDDDMRVAVIVMLMAMGWIYLRLRGKGPKQSWLQALGFGGEKASPGFASLNELVGALKDAGVSRAGLIVGVDFTRSNEWTGQKIYGDRSMHDVSGREPNPYQEVLKGVGRGLGPLNRAEKIWCYGFGDETTRDEGVFCFMPDDQPCADLNQALDRYAGIASAVALSGPTSFAPLIRKAIEIVKDSGGEYHCLVIIADGQVTKERDTVKAIQDASNYPLSIIMVGVGEGPWETCRVFDNRLPGRRYDNFRFVEHRRLKYGDAEALALSALAEVPDQYRAIRALGILGGAGAPGTGSSASAARSIAGGGIAGSAPAMMNAPLAASAPPSAPPSEFDEDEGVPEEYMCPLTLEVMIDPVVCEDGHSYERGALEAWLRNHNTSPMSNARLTSNMMVPNHALRNSIEAFRRERGY
ncbi:unnamed protein product [Scytosiphon promiscuus]